MGSEVVYDVSADAVAEYSDGNQRHVQFIINKKQRDYGQYRLAHDRVERENNDLYFKMDTLVRRTYETINNFLYNTGEKRKSYEAPMGTNYSSVYTTFNVFKKHFKNPKFCFGRFMGNDMSPKDIDQMLLNIYLTITGLLQRTVYIKPYTADDSHMGSVLNRSTDTDDIDPASKIKRFCSDYQKLLFNHLNTKRNIHLNLYRIRDDPSTLAVLTLLHEASHKFADTGDYRYFLYRKDCVEYYNKQGELKKKKIPGDIKVFKSMEIGEDGHKIELFNVKDFDADHIADGSNYMIFKFPKPEEAAQNADTVAAIIYHYGNGGSSKP